MTARSIRGLAAIGIAACLSLASACGDPAASAPPATPTPPAPPASAAPSAPDPAAAAVPTAWSKDLTKEQQIAFMKKNIAPTMGPIFQAADAKRYADFGCATCHGPAYKNPHDYLPRLTLKDGNITAFKDKPQVAKFMAESVSPKMAAAMGLPPYDPQTHQGFGCGGCHAIDMK